MICLRPVVCGLNKAGILHSSTSMEAPTRDAVRCQAGRTVQVNVAHARDQIRMCAQCARFWWFSEPQCRKECVTLFISHSELCQSVAPSPASQDAQLVYTRCRASYLIYDRCGKGPSGRFRPPTAMAVAARMVSGIHPARDRALVP